MQVRNRIVVLNGDKGLLRVVHTSSKLLRLVGGVCDWTHEQISLHPILLDIKSPGLRAINKVYELKIELTNSNVLFTGIQEMFITFFMDSNILHEVKRCSWNSKNVHAIQIINLNLWFVFWISWTVWIWWYFLNYEIKLNVVN